MPSACVHAASGSRPMPVCGACAHHVPLMQLLLSDTSVAIMPNTGLSSYSCYGQLTMFTYSYFIGMCVTMSQLYDKQEGGGTASQLRVCGVDPWCLFTAASLLLQWPISSNLTLNYIPRNKVLCLVLPSVLPSQSALLFCNCCY